MNKVFAITIMFISLLGCNSNGVSGDPETIWVNPYTRSDGTYIYGHYRNYGPGISGANEYRISIKKLDEDYLACDSDEHNYEKFAAEEAILECISRLREKKDGFECSYCGKNMSESEAGNFMKNVLQKKNCEYEYVNSEMVMNCTVPEGGYFSKLFE